MWEGFTYEQVDRQTVRIANTQKSLLVQVVGAFVIRFRFGDELIQSYAIEKMPDNAVWWRVSGLDGVIKIETKELCLHINDRLLVDIYTLDGELLCADYRGERQPFVRRHHYEDPSLEGHQQVQDVGDLKQSVIKRMTGREAFYGLGDKTGPLNKRGYRYTMWNTDDPSPHVDSHESLYKSIPFLVVLKDEKAFGFFYDTSYKSYFDMGKENEAYYYFGAEEGVLDYYFIYGPDMKQVVSHYTGLTGRTPLPQKWALGYHQSRWSYASAGRVRELARTFREKNIPCEAIHLDIDYMNGYRVFTWDHERFEQPAQLIDDLHEDGFKVVSIVDPAVKVDRGYSVFEEGLEKGCYATDRNGLPYVNTVWPGDAVFPDFAQAPVRNWWADKHAVLTSKGVDGVWNDMNEPASFNGPLPDDVQFRREGAPVTHREIHNVYGHLMSKATFDGLKQQTEKRPFVITRACYAGTQKYALVWTGDNHSFWEHLRLSLRIHMNLGISGYSLVGTDVGGFGSDCTAELLSRWVQVGCFTPFFRNHAASGTRDQEPWAFDAKTEAINRKYIELRYRLLPYIYGQMRAGEDTGLPLVRPLVLMHQADTEGHEADDQFYFGDQLLVAPVVDQGKRKRMVYLPEGIWYDYWTGERLNGKQHLIVHAPLDHCPLYVKAGTVLPLGARVQHTGEDLSDTLRWIVYPGDGESGLYVDDGESFAYRAGVYAAYTVQQVFSEQDGKTHLRIWQKHKGMKPQYDRFVFSVVGQQGTEGAEVPVIVKELDQCNEKSVELNVTLTK